jgi:hypothetical protein
MKKLALLAGLTGLLSAGAFAQAQSSVTFNVDAFREVEFLAGNITFTINDGGFNGPYQSSIRDFRVRANTSWSVSADLSGLNLPTGGGTWSYSYIGLLPFGTGQNWTTYSGAQLQLSGGQYIDANPNFDGGTLTLNIS